MKGAADYKAQAKLARRGPGRAFTVPAESLPPLAAFSPVQGGVFPDPVSRP